MKRLSYSKVNQNFSEMFSTVSRGEKHQNGELVDKSNEILHFLWKGSKKHQDNTCAFVPIPHEVYHPALSGLQR